MAWLVWTLACYFDYLPFVNAVFAAPIFSPLANLTFGAYLFHPIVIKIIAANRDGYQEYSALGGIQQAMLFSVLAYSVAIVAWCLVEKPFATFAGWLVPKNASKKPAKEATQGSSKVRSSTGGLSDDMSLDENNVAPKDDVKAEEQP